MKALKIAAMSIVAGVGLGGCGGVLGDLAKIDEITEQTRLVGDMAETSASMMPGGTATYNGSVLGAMTGQFSGEEAYYWGDAALSADFDVNTVSGTISGVRGLDRAGNLDDALGSIRLSNGTISGGDIAIDYDGDIIVGNDSMSFVGTASGAFHGAGAEGVLLGDSTPATINGVPMLSEFYIVGQQ